MTRESEFPDTAPRREERGETMSETTRKFRKRPVVIEAVQLGDTADSIVEVVRAGFADGRVKYHGTHWEIETLEGVMRAKFGDWLIRGINGELYACKSDIFAATYEPVEDSDAVR
jgi:hypothetical protein